VRTIRNMIRFYGEELLAPRPTPKLEDHPLSAVGDCLFNTFATNLHIGGRFSIRNLWTRYAVVTWTFVFHKMRGISRLAENRLASQEGLCCMQKVSME